MLDDIPDTTDDLNRDDYSSHHSYYYAKQLVLAKEKLDEEQARKLIKTVKKLERNRDWAGSTARNTLRNLRYIVLTANDYGFDENPDEWDAVDWNEALDLLAAERGVGDGQVRQYGYSARAYVEASNRSSVEKDGIDVPSPPTHKENKVDVETVLDGPEVMQLINAANNERDKAIIATLYEGAFRRTALIQLDRGHYDERKNGALVYVPDREGVKTAANTLTPVSWSKGFVSRWLECHPLRGSGDDEGVPDDAPLFCSIRSQDEGDRLGDHAIYTMLQRVTERTDLDKSRVSPHMLKHARGTELRKSKTMDKKDIEQIMDWSESTPMHARYSHADEEAKAATTGAKMGLDVETGDERKISDCPRCGIQLPPPSVSGSYCPNCTLKLSDEPPEWWPVYKSVAPEDDVLVENYQPVPSAIPDIAGLNLERLHRIRSVLVSGLAEYEAEIHGYTRPDEPDAYGDVSAFDTEDEADKAASIVEQIDDYLPQLAADDPIQFELLGDALGYDELVESEREDD